MVNIEEEIYFIHEALNPSECTRFLEVDGFFKGVKAAGIIKSYTRHRIKTKKSLVNACKGKKDLLDYLTNLSSELPKLKRGSSFLLIQAEISDREKLDREKISQIAEQLCKEYGFRYFYYPL